MDSFRLYNIKSFKDSGEIELKPITIFVGKNSSGKSSLARFPAVIAQTFLEDTNAPIVFNGKYIDYGNFIDVVHQHEGDEIGFSLGFNDVAFINKTRLVKANIFHDKLEPINCELKSTIRKIDNKTTVCEIDFFWEKEIFLSIRRNDNFELQVTIFALVNEDKLEFLSEPITLPLIIETHYFIISFFVVNTLIYNKLIQENQGIENFSKKLDLTYGVCQDVFFFLDDYLSALKYKFYYLGPFRTNPKRFYRDSESIYNYVGKEGEHTSMLLKQVKREQEPLFGKVNHWLQQSMGYGIDIENIPESPLFKIKVFSEVNLKGDNLIDVGYGISQILPIVTQLFYTKERIDIDRENFRKGKTQGDFFVIEQPEIHLHPNAQAELANLFVDKVSDGKSKLIIETHSEHLIRRLQSIVADPDNDFNADDVAIYYVDMPEQGKSTVQKMELTEQGQFTKHWPSGFFDKAYLLSRELFRNAGKRAANNENL